MLNCHAHQVAPKDHSGFHYAYKQCAACKQYRYFITQNAPAETAPAACVLVYATN